MNTVFITTYLVYLVNILRTSHGGSIMVETQYGSVRGSHKKSAEGRRYIAFEGIPFAKPPVESLRFEPPQPYGKWNGVLTANRTYICSQVFYTSLGPKMGQEDCLYLNVYVPKAKIVETAKLPVVVGIHGGCFMLLSPKMAAGEMYIMDRDVVYVNMNYRLGVFGFLSSGNEDIPGNMGLKDQLLALKWIKENIHVFGGDPNSITLTGLSAGAASVHFHILSPLSRGLFDRGLSQSGSSLHHWALVKNPRENLDRLGQLLDCPKDSKGLLNCLKQQSADKILTAEKKLFKVLEAFPGVPFGPVIEKGDNSFLPSHPYTLLSSGTIAHVPWMNSYVADEGIVMFAPFVHFKKEQELYDKWLEQAPYVVDFESTAKKSDWNDISTKIKDKYIKDEKITKTSRGIINIFTDRYFIYDGLDALKLHANNSKAPVYFYRYYFDDGKDYSGVKGVAHGDDGKLVFAVMTMPRKLPSPILEMKTALLDMVFNYANSGKAIIGGKEMPVFKGSDDDLITNINSPENITIAPLGKFEIQQFWDQLPIIENKKLFL